MFINLGIINGINRLTPSGKLLKRRGDIPNLVSDQHGSTYFRLPYARNAQTRPFTWHVLRRMKQINEIWLQKIICDRLITRIPDIPTSKPTYITALLLYARPTAWFGNHVKWGDSKDQRSSKEIPVVGFVKEFTRLTLPCQGMDPWRFVKRNEEWIVQYPSHTLRCHCNNRINTM